MSDAKRHCNGVTRKGQPCKAQPLKGRETCLSHSDAETRASVGFVAEAGHLGGRPRQPRVSEIYSAELHRQVGEHVDELIGRLVAIALDAERTLVVGTGPNARVEIAPDQALQLAAIRELNDRILGRPKQTTELTGAAGGPVEIAAVQVPDTDEYRRRVVSIASRTMGLPATNGNGSSPHH